jgi:hypothetical protein
VTIKRIALALLLLGLTGSAYYSYGRLNFGGKTAVFFNAALGGGQSGGRVPPRVDSTQTGQSPAGSPSPDAAGRGGMRPRRGQMIALEPQTGPGAAQPPSRGTRPAGGGEDLALNGHAPEGQRHAGLGPGFGGQGDVSLENVFAYTSIMGFVTMLTVLMDRCLHALTNWHRPARTRARLATAG